MKNLLIGIKVGAGGGDEGITDIDVGTDMSLFTMSSTFGNVNAVALNDFKHSSIVQTFILLVKGL